MKGGEVDAIVSVTPSETVEQDVGGVAENARARHHQGNADECKGHDEPNEILLPCHQSHQATRGGRKVLRLLNGHSHHVHSAVPQFGTWHVLSLLFLGHAISSSLEVAWDDTIS